MPDVVVLDQESADTELTVREHLFTPGWLVFVAGAGDEETGTSIAVALSRADVERVRDTLSAWLDATRAEAAR